MLIKILCFLFFPLIAHTTFFHDAIFPHHNNAYIETVLRLNRDPAFFRQVNDQGYSPFEWAELHGNGEAMAMLKRAEANLLDELNCVQPPVSLPQPRAQFIEGVDRWETFVEQTKRGLFCYIQSADSGIKDILVKIYKDTNYVMAAKYSDIFDKDRLFALIIAAKIRQRPNSEVAAMVKIIFPKVNITEQYVEQLYGAFLNPAPNPDFSERFTDEVNYLFQL